MNRMSLKRIRHHIFCQLGERIIIRIGWSLGYFTWKVYLKSKKLVCTRCGYTKGMWD